MASIIPSLEKIRQIRISFMVGPVPSVSGGRLLMLQGSVAASAPNHDHLCDVFFSVSSTIQLPDLLMATNALCMAVLPFLFSLPCHGPLRGKRLSCQLMGRRFQETFVMTKEFFQSFCKIFLQMESIHNLFGLGSACIRRSTKDLATITRDDLDFGVLFEPSGTRLHRALRQQISYSPMFEVHQDGPIACPLLPSPLVDSSHTHRALFRKRKLKHMTNERFCRSGHSKG